MRAVSAAFLRTLQGSFTPYVRVTIVDGFQTGTEPTGTAIDIIDGTVTMDGDADVNGRLDMIVPGALWPTNHGDTLLAPYGVEAHVRVGVKYSDDAAETVSLGYFRLKVLGQTDSAHAGDIRVTGQDRMGGVIKAGPIAALGFSSTDTVGDMTEALVSAVYPEAEYVYDGGADALPLGRDFLITDSRFTPLRSVATSLGMRYMWDAAGRLWLRAIPTDPEPVARLTGGAGGQLISAPRELNADDVVNAVVATGNGADDAGTVRGVVLDADPNSPTGYYSAFGPSPRYINSALLSSNDQCVAAAVAELARSAGLPYNVSLTSSPRYDLEPYDRVEVETPGMWETHTLAAVPYPLRPGAVQDMSTRQQLVRLVAG